MKNKIKDGLNVVILTYNSSSTIQKCLDSLDDQTSKNFEVLIVDDDSIDNTLEIARSFFSKSKIPFRILRNGSHGISRGRNIGIRATNTKYITFLDSDASTDKNWVKNILYNFKSDSKLAVVGGDTLPVYTTKLSYTNALVYETIRDFTRKGLWKIEGGNSAFDMEKLKNEFFNEEFKHCEDVEFFSRVRKKHKIKHNSSIKIDHEHKISLKKYFLQQYKYGMWETFFNFSKKEGVRLFSFIPSLLIIVSIFMSFFNPISILIIPLLSILFSLFVFIYKKPSIKFLPHVFISFFFKIIGWGTGVIKGLLEILFKTKRYKKLLK